MNYQTAAALSQNLAGIGDAFMRMNDPEARAKAALLGNQNALLGAQTDFERTRNTWFPQTAQAEIGAHNGTAAAGMANARQSDAQAALAGAQTQHWNGRNVGQQRMLESTAGAGTTGLDSLDAAFNAAGTANGIDPRVLKSIAMLETGNGTSSAYLQKKNAMGVSDANGPISFTDPVESINRMAQVLADPNGPYKGKRTLAEIGGVYAPPGAGNDPNGTNGGWGGGVSKFYQQLGGDPAASIFRSGEIHSAHPINSEADIQRLAINSAVSSDSNSDNTIQAMARAAGLFARTPEQMNQASLGVAGIPHVYNTDANNLAAGQRDAANNLAAGQRDAANNNQRSQTEVFRAATAGVGNGTHGVGGKSNPFDGTKDIGSATVARFSADGKTISDADRPKAQAWAASVAEQTNLGVPFEVAKMTADTHHGLPTTEDGWFSSPSKDYKNFNPTPITQEQATQVAAGYSRGAGGGSDIERIANAAQVFGMDLSQPAATATQPQTVGAPAATTPATVVPQTGVDGAASAFTRRLSSTEMAAAKSKQAEIAKLEARLTDVTRNLQTGNETVESPSVSGAYGMSSPGTRHLSLMSNDEYNARLDEYNTLKSRINSLKPSPQTASQGAVRRYNPATGTIE